MLVLIASPKLCPLTLDSTFCHLPGSTCMFACALRVRSLNEIYWSLLMLVLSAFELIASLLVMSYKP
jgi:hypothetical protein